MWTADTGFPRKLRVGNLGLFHIFLQRHERIVPNRHYGVKRYCAMRVLTSAWTWCDIVPMGQRHFIREWREYRRLNQEQLAERIGISRPHLSKIERGKRKYDQAFLESAADELGCAPADLIMRNPMDSEGIWSIWETLKPVERQQFVEIAKTFKRSGTEG